MVLGLNLVLFTTAYLTVASIKRVRRGSVAPVASAKDRSWGRGPWPMVAGAIGLALLSFATLRLACRP